MVKYKLNRFQCQICNKKSKQKSHHNTHLNSEHHKDKIEIFKLKLKNKPEKYLLENYGYNNIDKICIMMSGFKPKYDLKLQRKTNKLIYKFSEKELIENSKYENFKNIFKSKLKIWHNKLSGVGVTGDPALDDIINIIMLCYLDKRISNKKPFDLLNEKYYPEIDHEDFINQSKLLKLNKLLETQCNLCRSNKEDGFSKIEKIGQIIKLHPLTGKIIKQNNFINCKKDKILYELIIDINKFCEKYNIFEYSDIIGIAYEFMINEYKGGGGKKMGSYFTERKLMRMCFELIDKKDIINFKINNNSTIGDEYCGTFGFPLYLKLFLKDKFGINIKNENIYGIEFEDRGSRMAILNAMFSINNVNNVIRGDSFITNISPHLDFSVHNVPFGTRMKYENIKSQYEEYKLNNPNIPDFNDIIKSKANLDSTLASQMVIYKTKKIGICIIKDGKEAMTPSKELVAYRKFFCDSVNIKKILKIPSGAFSSTGTKTICLYFVKDGNRTENIQFLELNNEGDKIIELCNVKYKDLENNNYLWTPNTYLINEKIEKLQEKSICKWVKLDNIIEFMPKSKKPASYGKKKGKFNFYTSSYKVKKCDEYDYKEECIILGTGGNINVKIDNKFSCSADNIIFKSKYIKYIYNLLYYNPSFLEKGFKGAGIKHLSKKYLIDLKIPLPSLEIQNKIVKNLNNITNLINNNNKIIDFYKNNIKTILTQSYQ